MMAHDSCVLIDQKGFTFEASPRGLRYWEGTRLRQRADLSIPRALPAPPWIRANATSAAAQRGKFAGLGATRHPL